MRHQRAEGQGEAQEPRPKERLVRAGLEQIKASRMLAAAGGGGGGQEVLLQTGLQLSSEKLEK